MEAWLLPLQQGQPPPSESTTEATS